jgi:hypothetical protein
MLMNLIPKTLFAKRNTQTTTSLSLDAQLPSVVITFVVLEFLV